MVRDLPNVDIKRVPIEDFAWDSASELTIALSPRWLRCINSDCSRYALSHVLNRLADAFPEWVMRVSKVPPRDHWVLKGDLFHRPDAVLDGTGDENVDEADPYGCKNIYQRRVKVAATTLAMGRRAEADDCALGLVRIHSEAFAREDFLVAGESIEDDEIEYRSRSILDVLGYRGFFSMNWVTDAGGQAR